MNEIFERYTQYSKQNNSSDNAVKSQIAYFLHGLFSFFNEDCTLDLNREMICLWTKIHLLYRISKIFSDQNIKDQRYR